MPDVMLDLETMGTSPNAAIAAIGAVEFDAATNSLGRNFYVIVDLKSAVDDVGVIEVETVKWWLLQSDSARKEICRDGLHIRKVLAEFSAWLTAFVDDVNVWGNGAAFDNVILSQAYRRAGMPAPWKYRNNRCYRTLAALHPDVKLKRTGVHHSAIDDAISQATHLMAILRNNAYVMEK